MTKGFACHKGLAGVDVHNDPDRLDAPRLRAADGTWTDVSWDDAMATAAQRLRAIIAEHGANAIGAYVGNPAAFNALGSLHTYAMLRALGVRRTFSSGTQDCANKFVASEAVFGSANVHPIPDLDNTELCLIIGENPRASQGSFWSMPNILGELRRATARGARIVFINQRLSETAEKGIGEVAASLDVSDGRISQLWRTFRDRTNSDPRMLAAAGKALLDESESTTPIVPEQCF